MIPSNTAFLVVEMQNDLVHPSLAGERGLSGALSRAVSERGILPRLASLLDACRTAGLRVLYLTKERHPSIPQPTSPRIYAASKKPILVHGTTGADVVTEIAPKDADMVIARFVSIDPSYGSELWAVLRNLGVEELIVAGVSTTLAVEGLVRAAANRSYRVTVVEDCCASTPHEWHEFSVRNVLPLIADVVHATEIEAALS